MRTARICLSLATAGLTLAACGSASAPSSQLNGASDHGTLIHTGTVSPSDTQDIAGRFRIVGGPAPGVNNPLDGTIVVHSISEGGPVIATATASHGRFDVALPPGRYVFVGKTPQVTGPGPGCTSGQAVPIDATHTPTVVVQCDVP